MTIIGSTLTWIGHFYKKEETALGSFMVFYSLKLKAEKCLTELIGINQKKRR